MALAIALALHAAVAVALALYLSRAPEPDELAELDLTSVDLSFAETVEETTATVASAPSAPSAPVEAASLPPPADAASPPPVEATFLPPPAGAAPSPRQSAPQLPSLEETPKILPPTIMKQTDEGKRPETRDANQRETRDAANQRETRDANRREMQEETLPRPSAAPSAASAPRQARVDAPPRPRRNIKPDYPRESRLRGEHGDVALELDVAADGSVSNVRILKSPGYPLLEEAAVKAARAARFTPAKSGGKPVAATARLTLNFKLR